MYKYKYTYINWVNLKVRNRNKCSAFCRSPQIFERNNCGKNKYCDLRKYILKSSTKLSLRCSVTVRSAVWKFKGKLFLNQIFLRSKLI